MNRMNPTLRYTQLGLGLELSLERGEADVLLTDPAATPYWQLWSSWVIVAKLANHRSRPTD
jgi:hypothetical protein